MHTFAHTSSHELRSVNSRSLQALYKFNQNALQTQVQFSWV